MRIPGAALILGLASCRGVADKGDLETSLAKIKAVGDEGAGNAEASKAWQAIVARGPAALMPTLHAFDDADARAANWLRTAVDAIAERALAANQPPDAKALETFVLDTRRSGTGRRAAYEWLARLDAGAPERLLPGMLDDPGRELRRDAVARAFQEAEKLLKGGDKKAAADAFQKLSPKARDRDQVDALAKQLKGLGIEVDLQAHYGVVARWVLIASFDNTGMKGFEVAYAPEQAVDVKSKLPGKGGKVTRAVEFATPDPHGKVDLNAVLGKEMGAIAYAFAAVEFPAERTAELRVGTNNAVKMFLNGRQAFFRNEYHHGMKMDQYVARGRFRQGRNEILLKVCQNEQKEDWAQSWSFQARLCDALGGAVPFKVVTERPSD